MEKFKCCFCGQEFEGYGNNPYPANEEENARCCDSCNWTVVIPARIGVRNKFKPNAVEGVVSSKRGFYVGDICYVLSDEVYHGFWGDEKEFSDGVFVEPKTGMKFAVAGTAYGDGCYMDDWGNEYGVDAGVLGLVPVELVKDEIRMTDGKYFEGAGDAKFFAEDGWFKITLPSGKEVLIDTNDDEEEEDEEDYEEYEEEDEYDG